jgi:hypothetical protein
VPWTPVHGIITRTGEEVVPPGVAADEIPTPKAAKVVPTASHRGDVGAGRSCLGVSSGGTDDGGGYSLARRILLS